LFARVQPILLAGITARMLAELAKRAGYAVVSLDYFGDADLRRLCPGISLLRDHNISYTPDALVNAANGLDAPSVVYSASLENHPDHVARLAQDRELLGNSPETLIRVRDPRQLATALRSAGFCYPRTVWPEEEIKPEIGEGWLWKPIRSGGGHGIRVWHGELLAKEAVLQERLEGMVGSATFVANGLEATLVGVTEQLIGKEAFGASGFRYCGNIMPPRLPLGELLQLVKEVRAIVNHLTAEFGLHGLNGLDFIWHEGRVWTVELNPRPPAPAELMEWAYDLRLFAAHVQAFRGQLPSFDLEQAMSDAPAAGKAILFAAEDITLDDTRSWFEQDIRDIPFPGERIRRGNPVCTVLTMAETPELCEQKLERRVDELNMTLLGAGFIPVQI
jgi:predicted ATP-grasp superfamily ATP-dependent carboligase